MFCIKCGNNVGDAVFCPKCGNRVKPIIESVDVNSEPVQQSVVGTPIVGTPIIETKIKKKKKWPKVVAIVLAIVVLAGVGTYFAWPMIQKSINPNKEAITALKNATASLAESTAVMSSVTTSTSDKQELKGSYTLDKATVNGSNYLSSLKATTINYDIECSSADMTIAGTIGIGTSSSGSLIEMTFLMDSSTCKFQIPAICSESFVVSTSSIMDSSDYSYSDLFAGLKKLSSSDSSQRSMYSAAISSAIKDAVVEFDRVIDNLEYNKVGKEIYQSENGDIAVTVYNVTITSSQIKECAQNIVDSWYTDTAVSPYLTLLSFEGYTRDKITTSINDADFKSDSIMFTIYINGDGNIVKFMLDATQFTYDAEITSISVDWIGADKASDYVVLQATGEGSARVLFKKDTATNKYTLQIDVEPDQITQPGQNLTVGAVFAYTRSGTTISCTYDSIYAKGNLGSKSSYSYGKNNNMTFDFMCSANYTKKDISSLSITSSKFSNAINPNNMTELQQQTVALEVYNNISVLKSVMSDDLYNKMYRSLFGLSSESY